MANDALTPQAQQQLDRLKYEVASELGHLPGAAAGEAQFQDAVNRYKYEVARELGIPLRRGYNGDMPAKLAGKIGGRIGGRIGGQMVRRLIQLAEQQLGAGATAPR